MIRNALGLLFFGGAIALVACTEDIVSEKYATADSFCQAKAQEECKVVASECGTTEAACTSKRKDACVGLSGAAQGQGRTYKSAKAEDCITKTTAVYADRKINTDKATAFTTACEKVFAGTKTANAPCTALYECEGDLLCDLDKKVCAPKNSTGFDKPCNNPGDICETTLYCQQRGALKFCANKNKAGDACRADAPCLDELRCNGSFCVAKQAVPDPCDTNEECTTNLCVDKKCAEKRFVSETGTCKDFAN